MPRDRARDRGQLASSTCFYFLSPSVSDVKFSMNLGLSFLISMMTGSYRFHIIRMPP